MIYVTLRFDDGTICQYTHAYKTMKKYDLVGSIFVIGSRLWSKSYISVPQLLEMQNDGWEIGYHSWSHNNRWIQNEEEYEKETDCKALINQGLKMTTFCFPHSAYNRRIINYLRTKTAYKTLLGIPSKTDADSMFGPRPENNMYHSFSFNRFTTYKELEDRLRRAVHNNEYLIFMIHKVSPSPPGDKGDIDLKLFEKLMKLLKLLQDNDIIKVLTLRDAHKKLPK
jgi:peptidoglycan/xylan/chitin deacetylase (PgdA/CDA1 family)